MKYLKLENFGRGPAYAKALMGSTDRDCNELIAYTYHDFIMNQSAAGIAWGIPLEMILLPLDRLKLCPFVAMREGISLASIEAWDDTFEYSLGIPNSYYDDMFNFYHPRYGERDEIASRLVLDLAPVEAGEVEGVSIVEVEE